MKKIIARESLIIGCLLLLLVIGKVLVFVDVMDHLTLFFLSLFYAASYLVYLVIRFIIWAVKTLRENDA